MHKFLFYNKFTIFLYMFRSLLCSSSGVQNCIIQHLVLLHYVGGCPVHRLVYYIPLHVSVTIVLIITSSKLYYTASGVVTLCRWLSGAQFGLLYSSTCFGHYCAHHHEFKIVLYSIWCRHTMHVAVRCTGPLPTCAPDGHLQV